MCVARTFAEPLDQARLHGAPAWNVPGAGDWYALSADVVVAQAGVDPTFGLTMPEVKERLARHGANALQEIRSRSAWRIFLDQFASIVVALLGVPAAVA